MAIFESRRSRRGAAKLVTVIVQLLKLEGVYKIMECTSNIITLAKDNHDSFSSMPQRPGSLL